MRIELLQPDEVAAFFCWRGGVDGRGSCLDLALDSEIQQHLHGSRFIFLAKEGAGNEWIGTVSLALFHEDEELADGKTRVYLQALWVDEKWRRRGAATTLVQHSVQAARERGFDVLTLAVEPDEAGASALYLRLGFEKFKTSFFEWEGESLAVDCLRLGL